MLYMVKKIFSANKMRVTFVPFVEFTLSYCKSRRKNCISIDFMIHLLNTNTIILTLMRFVFPFFSVSICSCTLIMTARLVASVRCVWRVANWIWTFAVLNVPLLPAQHTARFGLSIHMVMLYRHYRRHRAAAVTTMYHRHMMKAKSLHQWRHPVSVAPLTKRILSINRLSRTR